jgi:hypothetical protein
MENNQDAVTATADTKPDVTDRFTVETNVEAPAPTEPPKEPEAQDKPAEGVKTEQEPSEEPPEHKSVNPRTLARKAEKERLIRENAILAEKVKQYEAEKTQTKPAERDFSKEPDINDYEDGVSGSSISCLFKIFRCF